MGGSSVGGLAGGELFTTRRDQRFLPRCTTWMEGPGPECRRGRNRVPFTPPGHRRVHFTSPPAIRADQTQTRKPPHLLIRAMDPSSIATSSLQPNNNNNSKTVAGQDDQPSHQQLLASSYTGSRVGGYEKTQPRAALESPSFLFFFRASHSHLPRISLAPAPAACSSRVSTKSTTSPSFHSTAAPPTPGATPPTARPSAPAP